MNGTILLVEDNEDDVLFLRRAFKQAGIPNPLQVVPDGRQAIDYLAGVAPYASRADYPLPCLVLLDLKLPRVMGLEVLQWVRQQPELEPLPIIVLTSSPEDKDIQRANRLGANSYLVKPSSADKLLELIKALGAYWLQHNTPPSWEVYAKGLAASNPIPSQT
jgi:CheY-like chemotaxis protein